MNGAVVRGGVAVLVVAGAVTALGVADRDPAVGPEAAVPNSISVSDTTASPDRDSLVNVIVTAAVFRADRQPASVAFRWPPAQPPADSTGGTAPAAPPVAPIAFRVTGTVMGTTPTAVIEGVPGVPGPRVFAVGEDVGGWRLIRIDERGVWLERADSTVTLPVHKPWEGS